MLPPLCSFLGYNGPMKVFVPFDEAVLDGLKLDLGMGLVPYQVGYRSVGPRDLRTGDELDLEPEDGWLEVVVG